MECFRWEENLHFSRELCLCCLELSSLAPSETAQNLQGQIGLSTMGLPRGWSMQNTYFLRPTGCLALDPVSGSVCVNLAPATCLSMWITHTRLWKTCFYLNVSLRSQPVGSRTPDQVPTLAFTPVFPPAPSPPGCLLTMLPQLTPAASSWLQGLHPSLLWLQ